MVLGLISNVCLGTGPRVLCLMASVCPFGPGVPIVSGKEHPEVQRPPILIAFSPTHANSMAVQQKSTLAQETDLPPCVQQIEHLHLEYNERLPDSQPAWETETADPVRTKKRNTETRKV